MTPTFVHCHLHSEFSLTDSTIRIGQLVKRCAELGMPAVAVTDNCNFFALVKFFKAAESAGIKPIAGADLFIDNGQSGHFRITALCQNHTGYLKPVAPDFARLSGRPSPGNAGHQAGMAVCRQ